MGWLKHQLLKEVKRNLSLALGRKTDVLSVGEEMLLCEILVFVVFVLENWLMKECFRALENLLGN